MFGKLSLEQRKALQNFISQSPLMLTVERRIQFLQEGGLGTLTTRLPLSEDIAIFAGALVRECERLGAPPNLGEYATVLLAIALRNEVSGNPEALELLGTVIEVYVPNHQQKYPFVAKQKDASKSVIKAEIPLEAPKKIKILVLAALPVDMPQVQLNNEMTAIQNIIKTSKRRDDFETPILVPSVRSSDLVALLDEHEPTIVHFMGHGAAEGGIYLLDNKDLAVPLNTKLLARVFSLENVKASLKGVILNACWGEAQAQAIYEANKDIYVVGATRQISDTFAQAFAVGFYGALGNGRSIPAAFEIGKTNAAIDVNEYEALDYTHILPES